jgi:hypothetical protein
VKKKINRILLGLDISQGKKQQQNNNYEFDLSFLITTWENSKPIVFF